MLKRKTTSLKIDPELWKKAKKRCIDKDTSISTYLESLIKQDLKLILSNVVKEKEAKRSPVLLKLDALNEKITKILLKLYVRLRGKAKKGVEVSNLTLLDKARDLESNWQIQEAISNYNAFIKEHPDYKDKGWVNLRLGYAHLKIGELKTAETLFSSVFHKQIFI